MIHTLQHIWKAQAFNSTSGKEYLGHKHYWVSNTALGAIESAPGTNSVTGGLTYYVRQAFREGWHT
jgi:hypothetical protein